MRPGSEMPPACVAMSGAVVGDYRVSLYTVYNEYVDASKIWFVC
jgi:hypothetical protein